MIKSLLPSASKEGQWEQNYNSPRLTNSAKRFYFLLALKGALTQDTPKDNSPWWQHIVCIWDLLEPQVIL